jgi:hypothetical protein
MDDFSSRRSHRDSNAQILEVFRRQLRQDFFVALVVAEGSLISATYCSRPRLRSHSSTSILAFPRAALSCSQSRAWTQTLVSAPGDVAVWTFSFAVTTTTSLPISPSSACLNEKMQQTPLQWSSFPSRVDSRGRKWWPRRCRKTRLEFRWPPAPAANATPVRCSPFSPPRHGMNAVCTALTT